MKNKLRVHNYSPLKIQYFVEPLLAAITAASLLGCVTISLVTEGWPHQGDKQGPAVREDVLRNLIQTEDLLEHTLSQFLA